MMWHKSNRRQNGCHPKDCAVASGNLASEIFKATGQMTQHWRSWDPNTD